MFSIRREDANKINGYHTATTCGGGCPVILTQVSFDNCYVIERRKILCFFRSRISGCSSHLEPSLCEGCYGCESDVAGRTDDKDGVWVGHG